MNRRTVLQSMAMSVLTAACVQTRLGNMADRSDSVFRHLRFALSLENPHARTLTDQSLWIYLPVSSTGTQALESYAVGLPCQVTYDGLGNTLCQVRIDALPPYATKILPVSVEVRVSGTPREDWRSSDFSFRDAERFVEADDPDIRVLASSLLRGNARETVTAIYDWVRSGLQYAGFVPDDLGAAYALRERTGDCTEYAYLCAALARACGLLARVMGGYVTPEDAILRPEGYHNWTEVYVEGAWRLLDAQKECLFRGAESYIAFEVMSARNQNALKGAHRFSVDGEMQARFV